MYSYCSLDDDFPEFVNSGNEEELPLRWKAPEVLSECRFSTASDVWALGVLMYEVLTYGCLPYRLISDNEELCLLVSNSINFHTYPTSGHKLNIPHNMKEENRCR